MVSGGEGKYVLAARYDHGEDSHRIQVILNRSICPTDWTLTGTAAPGQSRSGCNDHERVLPEASELEPHHQMQFSVLFRTPIFRGLFFQQGLEFVYSKPCRQDEFLVKFSKIEVNVFLLLDWLPFQY